MGKKRAFCDHVMVRIWVGSMQREGYENLRWGKYHAAKKGKARVEELLIY